MQKSHNSTASHVSFIVGQCVILALGNCEKPTIKQIDKKIITHQINDGFFLIYFRTEDHQVLLLIQEQE